MAAATTVPAARVGEPIDARVIVRVLQFESPRFGAHAGFAATPRRAQRDRGITDTHPRYLWLPKVRVSSQPRSIARAARAEAVGLRRAGWQPELIDAHHLNPVGVAAVMLAERLTLPLVTTAHGAVVSVPARLPGRGRGIVLATDVFLCPTAVPAVSAAPWQQVSR